MATVLVENPILEISVGRTNCAVVWIITDRTPPPPSKHESGNPLPLGKLPGPPHFALCFCHIRCVELTFSCELTVNG